MVPSWQLRQAFVTFVSVAPGVESNVPPPPLTALEYGVKVLSAVGVWFHKGMS